MAERLLTLRELNRATLARQFLLERTEREPLAPQLCQEVLTEGERLMNWMLDGTHS